MMIVISPMMIAASGSWFSGSGTGSHSLRHDRDSGMVLGGVHGDDRGFIWCECVHCGGCFVFGVPG